MKILVINSGSSSLKYQLFDMPHESPLCMGLVDRIGLETGSISHKVWKDGELHTFSMQMPIPNHEVGLQQVTTLLVDSEKGILQALDEVKAIGHRVVHGGEEFASTTVIDAHVKDKIKELFALAPLHNPPNYIGIEVAEKVFPNATQVAVFDTAFHQTMPARAYRYAIPKALYQDKGIRAYGFHGSSHQYVSKKAATYLDGAASKLIVVHLGNGSSITAVKDGQSIDHSMGLGPMGGLVMGTRAGDIDPSIIFHLINERGYAAQEVNDMLNKKSGLVGLCGYSDMRDVKEAIAKGDSDAALAYEIYAYRIKKYIGSYVAVLNGLDALIFTAGIGENDAEMRAAACQDLSYLGIELDAEKNSIRSSEVREVQKKGSAVKILVIPTNEELEIGQQTYVLVNN
ncbi:acetate/propionate family kinase [Mongoliitalea daihaiensis]|uniref:acetate/propionate family kinase n=1 Tax=Mongoliitalea daihaiensis TaxID=2782006 RepID=UPI001F26A949|nr:acetate kinase [Mongoliitalea daihaiensis]UJP65058.1 acetate kinase [Mongoliitalea daihaiensis]